MGNHTANQPRLPMSDMSWEALSGYLFAKLEREDHFGLDPSTVNYNPRLVALASLCHSVPFLARYWPLAVLKVNNLLGHRSAWFLKPEKMQFAKGVALTLSGLAFSAKPQDLDWDRKVGHLIGILEAKKLPQGELWAHDCDYRIKGVSITTSTPNMVTTSFVANSFYDLWNATGNVGFKNRFLAIVEEMAAVFPFREVGSGGCFMYTPITDYHVHNANLMMAELLAKYSKVAGDHRYLPLIDQALKYSVDDYRRTASFPYAGPPTENPLLDNYHVGYVLRSLKAVSDNLPQLGGKYSIHQLLQQGVDIYLKAFVRGGYVWKFEGKILESHSLAESVLIYKEFNPIIPPQQREGFLKAIISTMDALWDSERGIFINNVKKLFNAISVRDCSDMPRWSHAWLFYALSYPVTNGASCTCSC